MREYLAVQRFAPVSGLDREEYREHVLGWQHAMAELGETQILIQEEYCGGGNVPPLSALRLFSSPSR